MSYIEKEKLIKADIASIENRVRHAFNQGYDLGFKDGKERAKPQEPKIKVLERDEAMRKLGAVDIYQASAWITLLNDLEYLKLKICEVEE